MTHSPINRGMIDSPYLIFIKCGDEFSDHQILAHFGLESFQRTAIFNHYKNYALIANDGIWTMLADSWSYQIWSDVYTRPKIKALAESYDLFTCSIGDVDESFDFVYFTNGQLRRRYVVEDHDYRGGKVTIDLGAPLADESNIFATEKEIQRAVQSLAASVGIKTDYSEHQIRIYSNEL